MQEVKLKTLKMYLSMKKSISCKNYDPKTKKLDGTFLDANHDHRHNDA